MEVYLACWTIPRIGAAERYKQFYLDRYKRPCMKMETEAEDVEVDSVVERARSAT